MCEQCALIRAGAAVADEGGVLVYVAPTSTPSMLVVPKQHGPLAEQSQSVQEKLLQTAAQVSTVLFDQLGLHGTNIIGRDGEHGHYQVVGRMEDDGLEMRWTPKRASPEELESTNKLINEETWYIGKRNERAEKKIEITRPTSPAVSAQQSPVTLPGETDASKHARETAKEIQDTVKEGPKEKPERGEEQNYLLRQLTRRR